MKLRHRTRKVKIIFPSTITTFSMVFGFIAIILASTGQYAMAGYMVIVSLIMDGLDGKIARITNTASEFGVQYDSLADLVAFGVAPCVIYYHFYLHQQVTDQVYYLLPVMFLTCGAIRLARFNVTASVFGKSSFTGLPIPAAAFLMSIQPILYEWAGTSTSLVSLGWDRWVTKANFFHVSVILIVVLSLCMTSTLRFDTPVNFWFKKFSYKPLNYLVLAAFFSLLLIHFGVFALAISLYYLLSMLGRALYHRLRKTEREPPDEETPEDFSPPKVLAHSRPSD